MRACTAPGNANWLQLLSGASCRAGDPGAGDPQLPLPVWLPLPESWGTAPTLGQLWCRGQHAHCLVLPTPFLCRFCPVLCARWVRTAALLAPPRYVGTRRAGCSRRGLNRAAITILAQPPLSLLVTLFPSRRAWRRPWRVSYTRSWQGLLGKLAAAQALHRGLWLQRSPPGSEGLSPGAQLCPVPGTDSGRQDQRPHFTDAATEAGGSAPQRCQEEPNLTWASLIAGRSSLPRPCPRDPLPHPQWPVSTPGIRSRSLLPVLEGVSAPPCSYLLSCPVPGELQLPPSRCLPQPLTHLTDPHGAMGLS